MEVFKDGMAWGGRIESTEAIEGADRIVRATVVCGRGGRWGAVVPKEMSIGDRVVCFLPDAIVPKTEPFLFMEKRHWRVSMMRLRGAPSEVLALPIGDFSGDSGVFAIGNDVTKLLGILKYEKEIPAQIGGEVEGNFPSFIPKTDEPNFQRVPDLVNACVGIEVYVSTKYDGTSQTIYRKGGHFGVCSRNLELKRKDGVAAWDLVKKYRLEERLPDNTALQWECIGPGIQKNPLGLGEVSCRLFNAYRIDTGEYCDYVDLVAFAVGLEIPMVRVDVIKVFSEEDLRDDALRLLAEGNYRNGKPREGIVIRPTCEMRAGGERVSFKVINLKYKG